jgi:hypothetical protein
MQLLTASRKFFGNVRADKTGGTRYHDGHNVLPMVKNIFPACAEWCNITKHSNNLFDEQK